MAIFSMVTVADHGVNLEVGRMLYVIGWKFGYAYAASLGQVSTCAGTRLKMQGMKPKAPFKPIFQVATTREGRASRRIGTPILI